MRKINVGMLKQFFGSIPSARPERVAKHVFQEMDDGDFLAVDELRLPPIFIVSTLGADVWIFGDIVMLANVLVFGKEQHESARQLAALSYLEHPPVHLFL